MTNRLTLTDIEDAIAYAEAQGWDVVHSTWEIRHEGTHSVCPLAALYYAEGGASAPPLREHEWVDWTMEQWGICSGKCHYPHMDAFTLGVDGRDLGSIMRGCAHHSTHEALWHLGSFILPRQSDRGAKN